jgi:hypothetical protein
MTIDQVNMETGAPFISFEQLFQQISKLDQNLVWKPEAQRPNCLSGHFSTLSHE